jgi:hypothetical protein
MPFDAKLYRLASTAPVIPAQTYLLLLCCRRREHRVDRSYHLLHTQEAPASVVSARECRRCD